MAKTRARRTARRKTARGGKVIGQGNYGYVHYGKDGSEIITCTDGSEWKEGEVAKIGRDLQRELKKVEAIRAHYPKIAEFAILPTRVCATDEAKYAKYVEDQPDSDTKMMLNLDPSGSPEILFAPYGGETLTNVSGPDVVRALKVLREQVADMNANKVYHNDIGQSNIVYKDGKAYLIDFGSGGIADDDYNPEESPDLEMLDDIIPRKGAKKGAKRSRRKGFQRNRPYQ
jgi:hypothetical protein